MKKLTIRERQILELSSCGMSVKEIAYHLDLSESTVKVHFRNIHEKTGLQNDRETTTMWWASQSGIQLFQMPENVRVKIAAALLTLSVYTIVFNTSDMLRVFRGNGRVGAKTVNARTGSARSRRQNAISFEEYMKKISVV